MANGFTFEFSDQTQVNAYVLAQLSLLVDRTTGLAELKSEHAVLKQEISDIQDDMKSAKKWENIKLFIVVPLVAALHAVARALGANV